MQKMQKISIPLRHGQSESVDGAERTVRRGHEAQLLFLLFFRLQLSLSLLCLLHIEGSQVKPFQLRVDDR